MFPARGAALVCGDFRWPTCMHQSEPHLAVSCASGEIPHPHVIIISILSPLTRPILCTWRELCEHFIWTVDRSRCFWKRQGMKDQLTLFSIVVLLILAITDISPLTALRTPCFCKGGPPKWNSPEPYCAEVRCGKGPNWQLRLVAASSNMDLPITAAYSSLIWPRKNWKLLNNSWVITQARANLQVRSCFSPHDHILRKESSIFFLLLFANASALNIVAVTGDIRCSMEHLTRARYEKLEENTDLSSLVHVYRSN